MAYVNFFYFWINFFEIPNKIKLKYANLTLDASLFLEDINLVLHEMFHGLVFSSSLYSKYIDSTGTVMTNATVLLYFFTS